MAWFETYENRLREIVRERIAAEIARTAQIRSVALAHLSGKTINVCSFAYPFLCEVRERIRASVEGDGVAAYSVRGMGADFTVLLRPADEDGVAVWSITKRAATGRAVVLSERRFVERPNSMFTPAEQMATDVLFDLFRVVGDEAERRRWWPWW